MEAQAKQRTIYRLFFKNSSARMGWIILAALAYETIGDSFVNSFWQYSNRGVRYSAHSEFTLQKLFPEVMARVERRKGDE
jgi:hypothetical protein